MAVVDAAPRRRLQRCCERSRVLEPVLPGFGQCLDEYGFKRRLEAEVVAADPRRFLVDVLVGDADRVVADEGRPSGQ